MNCEVNRVGIVKRNINRGDPEVYAQLSNYSVATLHEAGGKLGLMAPIIRPIAPGFTLGGPALTVLLQPGDNWMLHVAAEQIRPGDVVVAACTSPCNDGYFGELLATSFRARGATGLVIEAGVRDVSDLIEMNFPVFSKNISARGTYKAVIGSVNVPIVCAGALVCPGDYIAADADGVAVVPSVRAKSVLEAARKRESDEQLKRERFQAGELGLDMYGMRDKLEMAGLRYVD